MEARIKKAIKRARDEASAAELNKSLYTLPKIVKAEFHLAHGSATKEFAVIGTRRYTKSGIGYAYMLQIQYTEFNTGGNSLDNLLMDRSNPLNVRLYNAEFAERHLSERHPLERVGKYAFDGKAAISQKSIGI